MRQVAYFGCWTSPGHFIFDQHGHTLQSFGPFIPESLDNIFCKPRFPKDSTIVNFKDYTLLAFLDNTIDKRPGCNSVFIVEGLLLSKKEIWKEASRVYPKITERLEGHIRFD